MGDTLTLTFTLTNIAEMGVQTNLNFIDNFPTGIEIAPTPNVGGTCNSNNVFATHFTPNLAAGGTAVNLDASSGYELAAGPSSCTITVDVIGTTAVSMTNETGELDSDEVTGTDIATADLEVVPPLACDINDTSIAQIDATTAQLSWTNSGDPAAEYRVFRSSLPYSGYSHLDETVSGTSHNVTIDPLQNYYYEVRGYADAGDADGDYSCKSGRLGVFSFAIVPGS